MFQAEFSNFISECEMGKTWVLWQINWLEGTLSNQSNRALGKGSINMLFD